MARHNDNFLMILDIDRVFSSSDLESVQDAEGEAA